MASRYPDVPDVVRAVGREIHSWTDGHTRDVRDALDIILAAPDMFHLRDLRSYLDVVDRDLDAEREGLTDG